MAAIAVAIDASRLCWTITNLVIAPLGCIAVVRGMHKSKVIPTPSKTWLSDGFPSSEGRERLEPLDHLGENMGKLDGKVAVVTGANSGIGLATAELFVKEGATVFITGRRQADLDRAVASIGGAVTAFKGDVSVLSDLDNLFELVKEKAGHIDILHANAGGGEFAPLGSITEESFDKTFAANVKGTLFTVQKALPLLRAGSSVILTGSTTSITGTPAFSVYSATKAAIRNFARTWIIDLKGRDIRVNVLSPGATKTPGLTGLVPPEHSEGFLAQIAETIPAGRVGDPEEIAKVALFLASDDSSFVNGAEFFVDGGQAQI